jgi:excisionase family DNA binding protein
MTQQSDFVTNHEKLYKVSEIATMFSVKPFTVREWIRSGKLKAVKLPAGSQWRIKESEMERFANTIYGSAS